MSVTDQTVDEKPFFDVNYDIEVIDELPPRTSPQGGTGKSVLEEQLSHVASNPEMHGKWVRIGRYGKGTAATAAKNVLQQRHGREPKVKGWEFATRRIDQGKATGLFVKHTPDAIEDGALAAHEKAEKARKAKIAKEREAKQAAEAHSENK